MKYTEYLTVDTNHYGFRELTGAVFSKLTVVELLGKRPSKHGTYWACICECGTLTHVTRACLMRGTTTSCGCEHKRVARENRTKHGRSRSNEYRIWAGIKTRCFNVNAHDYSRYGGRGITMCNRWADSFENFFNDMGERPSLKHSVERLNNEKGYNPNNCIWATKKVQANNTSMVVFIEHNGERLSMKQLCEKLKLDYKNFKNLYRERRLPLEQAISSAKKI